MPATLGESRLVILSGGKDGIVFLPGNKEKITVGSDFACDVRYVHDDVRDYHFAIYKNEKDEIKVANNSVPHPIKVNGVEVLTKKTLNSGDVITLLNKNFRWELIEDAKQRKLSLSKTERKRQAKFCMKTKKRITIHKINVTKKLEFEGGPNSQPKDEASRRASALETPSDEIQAKLEPFTTPTKEQSTASTPYSTPMLSALRNKENVTCSPKMSSLNLSGTLKTSFTPSKSASKKTPMKQALTEATSNTSDSETTPSKAKKSMYLIDLTTPHPTKTGVSSPSVSQSPKTTPSKKTPAVRHENTLLKSAIKNSTIKKNIESTPNRKVLTFAETDALQESGGSSLIELSMESESPLNGSGSQSTTPKAKGSDQTADFTGLQKMLKTPQKEPRNDLSNLSGVAGLMKTPAAVPQSPEDLSADETEAKEVQELIDSISSVLDEHETTHHSDESLEHNASQTAAFDGSFSTALEGNTSSPSQKVNVSSMSFDDNAVSSAESKFDTIAAGPSIEGMSSVDSKFDSLIGRPSISKTYQPAKKSIQPEGLQDVDDELSREKAESILSWVATARDSLAAESSNPVVQVNSSRYSNVTNESTVSVKTLAYDATTPKLVNLQPIDNFRKSLAASNQKLTKSPVTRLSLNENNVIVENYAINNEIQKSLRSTRKHIGNAMSMMHNTSHVADTTIDPNETINMASAGEDLDQSKQEPVNILSLDNQPQSSSNGAGGEFAAEEPPLNNFITFANSMDAQVESERDIFEVSSNDDSAEEELSQSDGYESSSGSDSETPDELEEKSLEVGEKSQDVVEKSKSLSKFRLSEQDMEDGVCPLNDSRTDEEVPSSQDADVSQNEKSAGESAEQSSIYCAATEEEAIDGNVEMIEAADSQSTTADEPANGSQENFFDSDFDMPATQAEEEQPQIEFQPQETIAEEESVMESSEAVSSSLVDAPEDATQNEIEQAEHTEESAEIAEQQSEVEEQSSEVVEEQPSEVEEPTSEIVDEETSEIFEEQSNEIEESQVDNTPDLDTDNTPDFTDDDSRLNNNQSSAQLDFDIPATQTVGDTHDSVADSSSNDATFSMFATQNDTALVEEDEASNVKDESSQVEEQPSEEQPSAVHEEEPSAVSEEPSEIVEETQNGETPDLNAEDEVNQTADDLSDNSSQPSAQMADFDTTQTQEYEKTDTTVAESFANESHFSVFATTENQTVIAGNNKVVPNDTALFTDTEFSRVEIPDELMESTIESSDDELQGLTDAPTFTKRAPSMAPLAGAKIALPRKTLAAKPEGEISDAFVDDIQQQHKEAVFGKIEQQQNLEAMKQRKSLAPAASVRTTEVRKTIVPSGSSLKPSFENFMKAKAQQLKEASDIEISTNSRSSEAKPRSSSIETSLRSTDIEVESSIECINLVTSTEEIADGSTTEASSQETFVASQEPTQTGETFEEKDSADPTPAVVEAADQIPDEEDFADKTPVVEETCVKKTAYVCTDDEAVAEPEVEVETPAVVETPAIPDTPRRRAAKVDYSALASGLTPRKLAEANKASGAPSRRGRSASVDSKASVESATISTTKASKRGKSVKKLVPIIQEEPETQQEVVVIEDSSQEETTAKVPEVKQTKKRGKKVDTKPEQPIEVQEEAVGSTTEQEAAGEASGRHRRGARVNYTDLVAGSKAAGDTPKTSKRGQKAVVAEKSRDDTPMKAPRAATPVAVPEKSKRTRKDVAVKAVVTLPDIVVEAVVTPEAEVAEKPVESKRGRVRKPAPSKALEEIVTPRAAATTSRRVISKRKNVEPEEQATPLPAAPEVPESPAPNKRKRRAASPAGPEVAEEPEQPVEPKVSARGAKKALPKSQSALEVPTEKATTSKSKKELTTTKSAIGTPLLSASADSVCNRTSPCDRTIRSRSREMRKTPEPDAVLNTKRRGRKEPVQSVEEPQEKAPAPPTKTSARNKRKLEEEEEDSSVEFVEEVAPTNSRRGRKQAAGKVPEPIVETLPKTSSRRNAKKAAEESPVEMPAAKTSKRGATKKVEETPPEPEEPVVASPPKKSRREAAKKVEEPVVETPVRKTRREAAKKVEEPAEAPAKTSKGRAKKAEAVEVEPEPVEAPAKTTKGRAKKAEVVEVEPEPPAPKRGGRAKKAATVEPESPEKAEPPVKRGAVKKQVTIATPSTSAATEAKPARATKRNQTAAVEEPVAKRATRARK